MPKVFAIRVVTGPRFLADGDLQSRGFNPINNLFQIVTAWSMKQSNCLIGSNRSCKAKQPLRRLHVSSHYYSVTLKWVLWIGTSKFDWKMDKSLVRSENCNLISNPDQRGAFVGHTSTSSSPEAGETSCCLDSLNGQQQLPCSNIGTLTLSNSQLKKDKLL